MLQATCSPRALLIDPTATEPQWAATTGPLLARATTDGLAPTATAIERNPINVKGANMHNGLLHIELEREIPEAMKPRTIAIGSDNNTVETKAVEAKKDVA